MNAVLSRQLDRKTFALWGFVLFLLGGMAVVLAGLPVEDSDFYDFYLAGYDLLRGKDVYAPQPNGLQGFFNPIWGAFPFVPLVAFPPSGAFVLWRLAIGALLICTMYLLLRARKEPLTPALTALAGWLVLIPWFVGQNAPLVAVGAFLVYEFGRRGRWHLAGAMTPLLAVKPHTVPFLPLALLWRGRWSAAKGMLGSLLVVTIVGRLAQPSWIWAWFHSRWVESQQGGGQSWPSSGLANVLVYFDLPLWLIGVVVLISLWFLWRDRHADWFTLSALALACGAAATPYIRAGDFPLLFPAFLLLPPKLRYSTAIVVAFVFFFKLPVPLLWLIPAITTGVTAGYVFTRRPAVVEAA